MSGTFFANGEWVFAGSAKAPYLFAKGSQRCDFHNVIWAHSILVECRMRSPERFAFGDILGGT